MRKWRVMIFKKICDQLNFVKQCKQYGLGIWQCPSFLFLILGAVIISAILIVYYFAAIYAPEPEVAALIVLLVAGFLMVIGYLIVQSFTRLANANRSKTEFISIASHQLRSPLTNIKWMLNILMKSKDESANIETLEQLRIIKENNDRMSDLVSDLLVASRVDQGRLDLRPEQVNLGQIIQELVIEYQSYAQANNIAFGFEKEENLPLVFVDIGQVRLATRHLMDNAIKYIKGVGSVKVRLNNKGKYIRCEIEDNGVGIPKAEQKRIFQKFFRSQNVMRYQTQGTGLGLFIVKAIIKNSKGKIGFSSQENKGSVFWFELPINHKT